LTTENLKTLDARTLKLASSVIKETGDNKLAEQLLEEAADKAENNPALISEIYEQLNSDITLEERKKAATQNKAGIKHYSNNELEQAVSVLRQALALTPRHISLNLNLIQVLIKLFIKTKDTQYISEINDLLSKLRHIPEDHKEYRRYQFLTKKFKKLSE